jgi:hypothetical protein
MLAPSFIIQRAIMKNRQKLFEALLDLLHDRQDVNKHSICKRSGVHRWQLERIIKKHKSYIDVEIVND